MNINKKLNDLKMLIKSRIKCNDITIFQQYLTCDYKIIIDTSIGVFKIVIAEYDIATKTIDELMNIVVDQFAELITREIFRL